MSVLYTIIGIATLIILHELGHFLAAKFFGMRVDEFGVGFPPKIFGKKIGETVYSLNLFPLGGFVKIHGEIGSEDGDPRSFANAPAWKRSIVISSGVIANFVIGWLIISSVLFFGTGAQGVFVERVLPDSPAEVAGFKAGDLLPSFKSSEEFLNFVKSEAGATVEFKVKRLNEDLNLSATLREPNQKDGALGVIIGDAGVSPHSLWESLTLGFKTSLNIIAAVFVGLASIIKALFTEGRLLEGFVGPIGVFGIAAQTAKSGIILFMQLLGLISLNLAALNVLPFPALDGGRLLFVIFEKIKGAKLTPKFEAVANGIGFSLLIALIVAITVRDVSRLF